MPHLHIDGIKWLGAQAYRGCLVLMESKEVIVVEATRLKLGSSSPSSGEAWLMLGGRSQSGGGRSHLCYVSALPVFA